MSTSLSSKRLELPNDSRPGQGLEKAGGKLQSVQQRRENQDQKYYTRLLLCRHLHGIGEYPYATKGFQTLKSFDLLNTVFKVFKRFPVMLGFL